ncbi:MAG: phosphatase PAP2 family protein [Ignavibacteria bacterium]|jgi:undecaprenyl-diphosphatase|nr:phosphatase PAP2 family protein [Ignavibacteria bacterium]
MIDFLFTIDLNILYFINTNLSNPVFDKFFSMITNVNHWFIAYIILWGILFFKGGKKGKIAAILVLFLVTAADQFGAKLLKELFQRIRPCNVYSDILTPLGCTGSYSFPSNHALNNFAIAMFFYKIYPDYKWVLFISAFLIALSRVYLGLHYPSDILGGVIFGLGFGYLFYLIHREILKKVESKV